MKKILMAVIASLFATGAMAAPAYKITYSSVYDSSGVGYCSWAPHLENSKLGVVVPVTGSSNIQPMAAEFIEYLDDCPPQNNNPTSDWYVSGGTVVGACPYNASLTEYQFGLSRGFPGPLPSISWQACYDPDYTPPFVCWDGSEAASEELCPVEPVTCWDGSTAPTLEECPEEPVTGADCTGKQGSERMFCEVNNALDLSPIVALGVLLVFIFVAFVGVRLAGRGIRGL